MLVSTSYEIPGRKIEALGLVRGNIASTRNIGRDMMAGMRNLVGGEVKSYTEMANDARSQAEQRMEEEARRLGADAIVAVRFDSTELVQGIIDMLAYGTAVRYVD